MYREIDPLLLHRLFRLAEWLEVDEEALITEDEPAHVFRSGGNAYCVLAEDELEDRLLEQHERLKGFLPGFLVQYMHLPAVRAWILYALRAREQEPGFEAVRTILCPVELMIDDKVRRGEVEGAHALAHPDDEERPGRFFIYAV